METKIFFGLAFLALIVIGGSYFALHLIDVGRDQCVSQVNAEHERAVAHEQVLAQQYEDQMTQASQNHAEELALLQGTRFVDPVPPGGVSKPPAARRLHATASPASRPTATPTGVVCATVVSDPSDLLRAEFTNAQHADQLAADYRELYDSWPGASKH